MLIILLVSDIPNQDGIFSQKQPRWLLDPANLFKTDFPFGYSFPFFLIFSTLKILIIILLVPDINKTGGIFATKNSTPDQWPPHRTNLFVYPFPSFPSFSIFSILFHTFSPFLWGKKLLIILLVSDIPNHDGIFSQKQTRWLLSIWILFSFFSYLFHLEILDNYSASTWHQQNWWNICNKKHHTRPMATTLNHSICLPFSILFHFFHSFPYLFTFPLREKIVNYSASIWHPQPRWNSFPKTLWPDEY